MHCLAYVTNDVITKIMPKALKKEFKYRCDELACRKIIRGDKWLLHCKSEHGFKVATGIEIKKTYHFSKEEWRSLGNCNGLNTGLYTII